MEEKNGTFTKSWLKLWQKYFNSNWKKYIILILHPIKCFVIFHSHLFLEMPVFRLVKAPVKKSFYLYSYEISFKTLSSKTKRTAGFPCKKYKLWQSPNKWYLILFYDTLTGFSEKFGLKMLILNTSIELFRSS